MTNCQEFLLLQFELLLYNITLNVPMYETVQYLNIFSYIIFLARGNQIIKHFKTIIQNMFCLLK